MAKATKRSPAGIPHLASRLLRIPGSSKASTSQILKCFEDCLQQIASTEEKDSRHPRFSGFVGVSVPELSVGLKETGELHVMHANSVDVDTTLYPKTLLNSCTGGGDGPGRDSLCQALGTRGCYAGLLIIPAWITSWVLGMFGPNSTPPNP